MRRSGLARRLVVALAVMLLIWLAPRGAHAEEGDSDPEEPAVLVVDEEWAPALPGDEPIALQASDATVTISVSGTFDTQAGRDLLPLVNAARRKKGVTELVWDTNLEKVTLQRAAELCVLWDHTRPDGTSYRTAYPASITASGETSRPTRTSATSSPPGPAGATRRSPSTGTRSRDAAKGCRL